MVIFVYVAIFVFDRILFQTKLNPCCRRLLKYICIFLISTVNHNTCLQFLGENLS